MKKDFIGIGMIGAGFARTTQLPGFRACHGARAVAIASAHRENAERVAREFEIEHVEDDWHDLVARDDVDLVSIVTPPSTHMGMALAALDAGKAVLCEKPMAMNAREARLMQERAQEVNALALIDHELRFLSERRRMREMIRGGEVGRIRHAKFLFRSDSRAAKAKGWDWWSDAQSGGGVLGAIGSHAVDSLRWLLDAEISEVFGSLTTHVKERLDKKTGEPREVTTDDEANLILRFARSELAEDATATLSLSVVEQGRPAHQMEVFGIEGALLIEESGALWRSRTGTGMWERVEVELDDLAAGMRESSWSRGFTVFAREIVEALREGRTETKEAATFVDGYHTQLVLDAARRSHETGCRSVIQD